MNKEDVEEEIFLVATAATESGHEAEAVISTRPVWRYFSKQIKWPDKAIEIQLLIFKSDTEM